MNKNEKILVLDFGSQYTFLIIKAIENLNYKVILKSSNISVNELKKINFSCLILSGSPKSIDNENNNWLLDIKKPILAICYGMQLIAKHLGYQVNKNKNSHFGLKLISIDTNHPLFHNLPKKINVLFSHNDSVNITDDNVKIIATINKNIPVAFQWKNNICLQFHPETNSSIYGINIIENFLKNIVKIAPDSIQKYQAKFIEIEDQLKHQIINKKIILAFSGGIDSLVAAKLIHKIIGKNLTCLFINTGLVRNEDLTRIKKFKQIYDLNIKSLNKSSLFLKNLKNITSPEIKRRIIGKTFIDVFKDYLITHKYEYLAQGTIASDVIESSSASKHSEKIKSHHNVGGLPKNHNLKIIEPLKTLFKDEVINFAKYLDIDKEYYQKHPFPGPGLAIRIIGKITTSNISTLKKVDNLFIEQLKKWNLYHISNQAFAVLLPIKTVGVKGDFRTYQKTIVIRSVISKDYMTAVVHDLPYKFLIETSKLILNNVNGVNRVCYDITPKPPGTIEWE